VGLIGTEVEAAPAAAIEAWLAFQPDQRTATGREEQQGDQRKAGVRELRPCTTMCDLRAGG
jgi:hypothetical protein